MKEQDLLKLKKEIEEAKEKFLQLQGQQKALFQRLKEEFGCKTIKQAEEKIEELQKEINTLDEEIEEGILKLENLLE